MDMSSYDPFDDDSDDGPTSTTYSDPMSDQEDLVTDAISGHVDDGEDD